MNIKKIIFLLILATILVSSFIIFNIFHTIPTAMIAGHQFFIEVAKTPQEQEVGLAKYDLLPQEKAMYFPFAKPGLYAFWMKGMHFPIDILFIRSGKIVTIEKSVPAPFPNEVELPIYRPTGLTDSVLEINAGLSDTYGFKVGDNVIVSY